MYSVIVI